MVAKGGPYFNSRPCARGDRQRALVVPAGLVFQFPPLREGRQTMIIIIPLKRLFQFPPLREGRLSTMRGLVDTDIISIPAPARGATTYAAFYFRYYVYFNSRPCARGDNLRSLLFSLLCLFQFPPLREGRPAHDAG